MSIIYITTDPELVNTLTETTLGHIYSVVNGLSWYKWWIMGLFKQSFGNDGGNFMV